MKIGIINYGMGNLTSVYNAIRYVGMEARILNTSSELKQVDKVILPGVGAFANAMINLESLGWINEIKHFVEVSQKPLLGICLGMQLLLESSEEYGINKGLGLIKGKVISIKNYDNNIIVPHMGWNDVYSESEFFESNNYDSVGSYYFVHSYCCDITEKCELGITTYGRDFHSFFKKDNLIGCQFHPEKSLSSGLSFLKYFEKL